MQRRIGIVSLIVGCMVYMLVPSLHFHENALHAVDFKTVYSSSKCLLDHCNPYDSQQLEQEYAKGGGDFSPDSDLSAFQPYQALYPPSSLFWVTPFAALPWNVALPIWTLTSAILFVIAAFLVADLCVPGSPVPVILIGIFVATSTLLLSTAQPSGPAISLCAIGVWSLIRNRLSWLGILCFALSLALKPQLGGLVLVYFFLAGGVARRRSLQIAGMAFLFSLPGILWASATPQSAHWVHDLRVNLALTARPGSLNDPGPTSYNAHLVTDLQSIVSVFRDSPSFYNHVSWAIVGTLLLLWGYVAWRAQPSLRKDLLGIAAISCLCLLPIYHRHYDVRLLLLTFPAVALLLEEGGWAGGLASLAAVAVIAGSHPTFIETHLGLHQESLSKMQTVLLLRTSPLVLLFSSLFYLTCFTRTLGDQAKRPEPRMEPVVTNAGRRSVA